MNNTTRGRLEKVPIIPTNWEDEYRKLQDKFQAQKRLTNDQDDHIRKMQSKMTKLETDFMDLARKKGGGISSIRSGARDRDEENLIAKLTNANHKLKSTNAQLVEKNKALGEQLEKRKREIKNMKMRIATTNAENETPSGGVAGRSSLQKATPSTKSGGNLGGLASSINVNDVAGNKKLLKLAEQYKQRAMVAEEQLRNAKSGGKGSSTSVSMTNGGDGEKQQLIWQLQQLQSQYDVLASRSSNAGHVNRDIEEQNAELNSRVRQLRRALEDLQHEKQLTDAKASRANEMEEMLSNLRSQNRSLEDRIARLCSDPSIGSDVQSDDYRRRYETSRGETEDLRKQLSRLQETVQTYYTNMVNLKEEAARLRADNASITRTAQDLQLRGGAGGLSSSTEGPLASLISDEDGVTKEELERALTLVKRRGEAFARPDFLEDPEGDLPQTVPTLQRKMNDLMHKNQELSKDLEVKENMLRLQSAINKDLHKEIETIGSHKDRDRRELQERANSLEELAMNRLEKIRVLEAQLRQHLYSLAKIDGDAARGLRDALAATGDTSFLDTSTVVSEQDFLVADLMREGGGNPAPDENLLEVWIKGASIRENVVGPGASTFVVLDFYAFESQTTQLVSGSTPSWDFAATFKLNIDDGLIRYLATDVMVMELNMTSHGDFTTVGRATVALSTLLKSKPFIRLPNHPIMSTRTGEVIAHLSLEVRLAVPVSELYRLFLGRHPNERHQIEDISAKRVVDAMKSGNKAQISAYGVDDEARLYNDFVVTVLGLSGLATSSSGRAPSPYVQISFLGFPNKMTNPVMNKTEANLDHRFQFAMVTNDAQIRLMRRSTLLLSVFDMDAEDDDLGESKGDNKNDQAGLLGEVAIPLALSAEGSPVKDSFHIKDRVGNHVGVVEIALAWRAPFKKPREIGPRALSGIEVENLISCFSSGDIGSVDGHVDYLSFCRFISPPEPVRRALDVFRNYCTKKSEEESIEPRKIINLLFDAADHVTEDAFIEVLTALQLDCRNNELALLHRFMDLDKTGSITLDQLLANLNLDEVAGVPGPLQDKIRSHTKDLENDGTDILQLFKNVDQWGANGLVSRMEFKKVLKNMGFHLIDDEEQPSLPESYTTIDPAAQSLKDRDYRASDYETTYRDEPDDGGDELLLPTNDDSNTRSTKDNELNRKREQFEEQMKELKRRSDIAAAGIDPNEADNDVSEGARDENGDLLPRSSEFEPMPGDHLVAMNKSDSGRRSHDKSTLDSSATKLQAMARGRMSRRGASPTRSADFGATTGSGKTSFGTSSSNFLEAEKALRKLLSNNSLPDLVDDFVRRDPEHTGVVDLEDFQEILALHRATDVGRNYAYSLGDYFSDGSAGVDYGAFQRFIAYKAPDDIASIRRLKSIILPPDGISQLKRYDSNGSDYIRRQDMTKALSDWGYGHFNQIQAMEMASMFECKIEGQVHYVNFVEYVSSCDATIKFNQLCSEFKSLLLSNDVIQNWFSKIDRGRRGLFDSQDLDIFLAEYDLVHSKDMVNALFKELDSSKDGVRINDLETWVRRRNPPMNMRLELSMEEKQRKASAFMALVGGHSEAALDSIAQCFRLYDWQSPQSGTIGKNEFIHAVSRAGFPFTREEITSLAEHFQIRGNKKVDYKKFMGWTLPSARGTGAIGYSSLDASDGRGPKNSIASLIRFLEVQMKRNVDLLAVFGKRDQADVGRITAQDFIIACAELGATSVTPREAIELADRFSAAPGSDLIMYRRIVQGILSQLDESTGAADVDVVDSIRSSMYRSNISLERLRDSFQYYDKSQAGKVRFEDLALVFENVNLSVRRQELETIQDVYSMGGSSWVHYLGLLSALQVRGTEGNGLKARVPFGGAGIESLPSELVHKFGNQIEMMINRGVDYRAVLDRFDDEVQGSLMQSDFRSVLLNTLQLDLTPSECEALERAYRDIVNPRRVCYTKLIHDLHPREQAKGYSGVLDSAEVLRQAMRKRCDYRAPSEVRHPYRKFERNATSTTDSGVDYERFGMTLKEYGIRLAADQERRLFSHIAGGDEKKLFFYTDFAIFVKDPMYRDIEWKWRKQVNSMRVTEDAIMNALEDAAGGVRGEGLLTPAQFQRALRRLRIELSGEDVDRFKVRFDPDEIDRIDIARFGRYLSGKPAGGEGEMPYSNDTKAFRNEGDPNNIETKDWSLLRKRITEKMAAGFSAAEVFAIFDDGGGVLTNASLQVGARELNVNLSRIQARSMMRRFTKLHVGGITKQIFFDCFGITLPGADSRGSRSHRDIDSVGGYQSSRSNMDSNNGVDSQSLRLLRMEIDALSAGTDMIPFLRRALEGTFGPESLDSQRPSGSAPPSTRDSGYGDYQDFQAAMKSNEMQVNLSRDELKDAWRVITRGRERDVLSLSAVIDGIVVSSSTVSRDRDGRASTDRRVTYEDERNRIDNHIVDSTVSILKNNDIGGILVRVFMAACAGGSNELQDLDRIFRANDRGNTGCLIEGEFERCLKQFNLRLESRDLNELLLLLSKKEVSGTAGEVCYEGVITFLRRQTQISTDISIVIEKLSRRVQREMKHGQTFSSLFNEFDKDGSGEIDMLELERGLLTIGIQLDDEEIAALSDKFTDDGRSRRIRIRDFVHTLNFENNPEDARVQLVEAALARLRDVLADRFGSSANAGARMKDTFEQMDINGDMKLTAGELREGLLRLKIDVTMDEVRDIIEVHDNNRSGTMEYTEFLRLIGQKPTNRGRNSPTNGRSNEALHQLKRRFDAALGRDISDSVKEMKVIDTFRAIDRDRSGYVDRRDFRSALDDLRVDFNADDLTDLFNDIGTREQNSRIDYRKMCEDIFRRDDREGDRYDSRDRYRDDRDSRGGHSSSRDRDSRDRYDFDRYDSYDSRDRDRDRDRDLRK